MYSCFTEKGEGILPSEDFIKECHHQGIEPIIFLDSCVCLHIIKAVDYGKLAKNVDLFKLLALKEYLTNHPNIKINPFFAFLELCNQSGTLDKVKLQDFKLRIEFFEQIPLKAFKKFKYDFQRDVFVVRNIPETKGNPMEMPNQILKNSYCSLLKIRSIALQGLTKGKAESNINEFDDWMIKDLDIFRGAEYKLAMNVFGGNTAFRKMIGLDCKQKDVKQRLIGTAWDMFHSKFAANSFRLSESLGRKIYPFFLTSDANLFKIFQNLNMHLVKDGGKDFVSSFMLTSDFSYPHLDDSFLEKNNRKLLNNFIDRYKKIYAFDEAKVDKMINQLEVENGI